MTKITFQTNSNSGAINEFGKQHFNACFFISILDYFKFNNLNNYVSIKDLKSNVYHDCEMFDSDNYTKNINVINYLNEKKICCVVYKYLSNSIDDDIFNIIGNYDENNYIIKICNFGLGHFEFIKKFNDYNYDNKLYKKINIYNTNNYKYNLNNNDIDIKSLNNDLNYYYNSIKLIVKDITTIVDEIISYKIIHQKNNISQLEKYFDYFKLLYKAYHIKFNEIEKNSLKSFEKYRLSNINIILLFEDIREYFFNKYNFLINNNNVIKIIDNNDIVIKNHFKNPKSVIIINYENNNYKIDISFIQTKIIDNIDKIILLNINDQHDLDILLNIFKTD